VRPSIKSALALTAILLAGLACCADEEAPAKEKEKPAPLSPDEVLLVAKSLQAALEMAPDWVLVAPEKWRKMRADLDRLRALAERRKAQPPSKCVIKAPKGKIKAPFATLSVEYELTTTAPDTTVALGCGGLAHITDAKLDNRPPALHGGGAEGYFIQVEKAGEHQVVLELVVPVLPVLPRAGGGHGLALDLPRAAITRIDLELPKGVKDVRLAGRPAPDSLLAPGSARLSGSLGPVDRLDLTWKGAGATLGPTTMLTAEGLVRVKLDSQALTTEAVLTLRPKGGPAPEWQLVVPSGADVSLGPEDKGRVEVKGVEQKGVRVVTLRVKEAPESPLVVTISARVPQPRPPRWPWRVTVGPFNVLRAAQQFGQVLVANDTPNLHLDYFPQAELALRSLSDDEQKSNPTLKAAFRYGQVNVARPAEKAGPPPGPWLGLEAELAPGQIKARVEHALKLLNSDPPVWELETRLTATPRWADVGRLELRLPPGCQYAADRNYPYPPGVLKIVSDPKTVEVWLKRTGSGPAPAPIVLSVFSTYPAEPASLRGGQATFLLPRPVSADEDGGTVTVVAPKGVELLAGGLLEEPRDRQPAGLELTRQSTRELVWRSERRAPEQVKVVWRAWRPEVRVDGLVDLTLTSREAQVRRHELRLRFPPSAVPQLSLRVPAALSHSLRVLEGGKLSGEGREAGKARLWSCQLGPAAKGPGGPEHLLVLAYEAPLPAEGVDFAVPLVRPEVGPQAVAHGTTRVRIWADDSPPPVAFGPGWSESKVEQVEGDSRLPARVLRSSRVDQSLTLRLRDPDSAPSVLVDRALVRAAVGPAGTQSYRARYVLNRLAARHLDLEMPAPVSTIELRVWLDGKKVTPEVVDEHGRRADGGRVARLRLAPELVRPRSVLKVRYRLPPGRGGPSTWQTALQQPVLRGQPAAVSTRWVVLLPASWVALGPQDGGPRSWGRRGPLLAPRLAQSAGELEDELHEESPDEEEKGAVLSLDCSREGSGPLVVTHVPNQAWLLLCSLGLLALGLAVSWLTWPSREAHGQPAWLWPLLALAALGLVVAALLWPTLMGQVAYGCQPGAAVLVVVALVQWLWHERYRRQIIFLPTFSRARPGSSLSRAPAASDAEQARGRAPGEPSTVDVPRPAGSSVSGRSKEGPAS
jgi:hypothetical protein